MNLQQINEWRIAHGLQPVTPNPVKVAKAKRNARNRKNRGDADRSRRMGNTPKGKKG